MGNQAPEQSTRTVFELNTLLETLDLTDGDPSVMQLGGYHKDVTKQTAGKGYESHHIPPQSVFTSGLDDKTAKTIRDELPTIAVLKEDHQKTSSYAGKIRKKYVSSIDGNRDQNSHKENVAEEIERGFLPEMIRDEIYEIQRDFGHKYDGGIKQFIQAMIEYVKKNG